MLLRGGAQSGEGSCLSPPSPLPSPSSSDRGKINESFSPCSSASLASSVAWAGSIFSPAVVTRVFDRFNRVHKALPRFATAEMNKSPASRTRYEGGHSRRESRYGQYSIQTWAEREGISEIFRFRQINRFFEDVFSSTTPVYPDRKVLGCTLFNANAITLFIPTVRGAEQLRF